MSPLKDGHEGGPEMKDDSNGMPKLYDAAGHMHTPFHKAGPGDLDGDGEMSDYEANRQEKIEKAMAKKNKK